MLLGSLHAARPVFLLNAGVLDACMQAGKPIWPWTKCQMSCRQVGTRGSTLGLLLANLPRFARPASAGRTVASFSDKPRPGAWWAKLPQTTPQHRGCNRIQKHSAHWLRIRPSPSRITNAPLHNPISSFSVRRDILVPRLSERPNPLLHLSPQNQNLRNVLAFLQIVQERLHARGRLDALRLCI
jgi:hypothetical protein